MKALILISKSTKKDSAWRSRKKSQTHTKYSLHHSLMKCPSSKWGEDVKYAQIPRKLHQTHEKCIFSDIHWSTSQQTRNHTRWKGRKSMHPIHLAFFILYKSHRQVLCLTRAFWSITDLSGVHSEIIKKKKKSKTSTWEIAPQSKTEAPIKRVREVEFQRDWFYTHPSQAVSLCNKLLFLIAISLSQSISL